MSPSSKSRTSLVWFQTLNFLLYYSAFVAVFFYSSVIQSFGRLFNTYLLNTLYNAFLWALEIQRKGRRKTKFRSLHSSGAGDGQ